MEEELSTEQRILESAQEVFLKEGYAGARMQEIADRAGINKAMLHYYFRSKDKLFELILRHKMKQFVPQITHIVHKEDMPFVDKLDQFVLAYLGMLRKNPSLPLFIISTLTRNPDLMPHLPQAIGLDIVQAMESEMSKGNIRSVDPHQFMLTLIGMCIFPFLGRPIFSEVFQLSQEHYDKMLRERHVHVMQYARIILAAG